MQEKIDIARSILLDREKGTQRLVAEYRDRLYSVAFALCRNHAEAEDLAFRTIERAVSKIESYEERDSFYEWLQIILLNLYRNSLRGKMVRSTMAAGAAQDLEDVYGILQDGDVESAEKIYASVDSAILRDAINRLPDDMKEMVVLRYFMDMPLKKIAKILSMPVGTVMSRLYYTRLALAHRLGAAIKKPAVAIIAIALMLFGVTAAVIVGNAKFRAENDELADGVEMIAITEVPSAPQTDTQLGNEQGETEMNNGIVAALATTALVTAGGAVEVTDTCIVSNETDVSSWTVARGGELRLGADVGDPLVHWTFDNAAQPGADTGSLGKNFNFSACMTATNDATRGHCVYFDGSGQVWVSTAAGLPSDTAFTIAGWMKSEYQNSGLLYWGANSSVKSGGFGLQEGKPTFYFYGGGDLQAPASATYYDGTTWTHFTAVYEPSAESGRKMRVYVNGVQAAAMDPTKAVAINTEAEFRFGTCTMYATRYNKGFVDDVMIFGRALSNDEISILASTSRASDFLPPSSTVSVAGGGVVSVGIGSQTFGGLSGGGTLQVDGISEARFASEGSQTIGEIEGEGQVVVASGTLEAGLADTFAAHTVLHYTFDDPADLGADTGSAGLHLKASTASADAQWADVTSNAVPGAVYFDGAHFLIPTGEAAGNRSRLPSGNSAYTIAVRLTLNAAGGRDGISSWGLNGSLQKNGLRFYNDTENLTSKFGLLNYNWGADTPAPLDSVSSSLPGTPAGVWHVAVVTYDPTTHKKDMYVDGALKASVTLSGDLSVVADRFNIGRAEGYNWDYYRGYIDDYRVLNCAVTADEARALVAEVSTSVNGTAVSVAEGATLSIPAGKAVSVGSLEADGTVSVGGRLNVTKGASTIDGALTGGGVVATSFGSELSISGVKAFAGTVKVENGTLCGAWSMPSAAVCLGVGGKLAAGGSTGCAANSISLADGCAVDLGTLVEGAAYWTSSAPLALPDQFTVRVTANDIRSDNKTRTIFAAESISGSIENWTLEAVGFPEGREPELRAKPNRVDLFLKTIGLVIIVK